jgi:hypothetical protein
MSILYEGKTKEQLIEKYTSSDDVHRNFLYGDIEAFIHDLKDLLKKFDEIEEQEDRK